MSDVALFNDTRPNGHYGCDLVMANLLAGLSRHGMTPRWLAPVGKDWRLQAAMPRTRGIRAVILNAEGSLHHSRDHPHVHGLADAGRYAREELGVPAFLINATLHENERSLYDSLRHFDAIYVRESASRSLLASHDIEAALVPDLSFARPVRYDSARRQGYAGTDSVLSDVSAGIREYCRRHRHCYVSIRHPVVPSLRSIRDVPRSAARLLRLGVALVAGRTRPDYFLRFIGSRRLVITGRFHGVVMCLLTRTPFVAVESNTPKISALLEDALGSAGRVLPLEALETLDPTAYERWGAPERARLEAYCADAPTRIDAMIRSIADKAR